MSEISSGCYIIDEEYNVLHVNETAAEIYPQLKVGEKCYKNLLGLDEPCGPCPVCRGIKGPRTYTDPIRGISETVDAVEAELPGHGLCHMMVFSTVGQRADLAATLPTSANELRDLALISALAVDFSDVFSVEVRSGQATLYRHDSRPVDGTAVYCRSVSYADELKKYAERYVAADERELFLRQNDLDYICANLKNTEAMVTHCRVVINGEQHYYCRKIARAGEADSFEHIVVGVACEDEDVLARSRREELEKNLRQIEYDSLTGLYTREAFLLHGNSLLRKFPEQEFDFCVLKIENLGMINHQFGRETGNRILRLAGQLLKRYDDEMTCLAYMGDGMYASFTVTAPTPMRKAAVHAFRDEIIRCSYIKTLDLKWSVYVAPRRSQSVEEIIAKTNYALSTIRADSHEDYVEFDQAIVDRMQWEETVETNFDRVLAAEEFKVWYQPKYSVRTGQIVGAEALVRWQPKEGKTVTPDRFVPVLERCGKIDRLDEYVFCRVCALQQRLRAEGKGELPISVNLSRASMFSGGIAENYAGIAQQYAVPPHTVPIEITESAAVRAAAIEDFAGELIRNGFVLHMDDFGSGYSSLASLQVIPFECIKLDKTLVDNIGRDAGDNLLKHTIAFAKESGKKVIAEGVETYEQYTFLKIAGCDAIQGYYFSKPVEEAAFTELLNRQ